MIDGSGNKEIGQVVESGVDKASKDFLEKKEKRIREKLPGIIAQIVFKAGVVGGIFLLVGAKADMAMLIGAGTAMGEILTMGGKYGLNRLRGHFGKK